MNKLVRLLIILGLGASCYAQTTQIYTGVIKDLSGAVVTSGQVTFTLAPPTASTIPGTGSFVPSTITCNINADGTLSGFVNGAVSGACTVIPNISISPTGTSYRICEQPNFATPGSCFFDYALGGTKDISSIAPTLPTGPINYGGVPGPVGPVGPQGTGPNLAALTNNVLTTNPPSSNNTVRAWGTSQTQGFGIDGCTTLTCHPVDSYPQLFGNAMGWNVDNQGYGSSQCADLSYSGTSESMWATGAMAITTSSRNIYGHIRNDMKNGIFPFQLDYARGCIEAEMAWLAIPEQSVLPGPGKIRAAGSGCTKTGTWVDGAINAAESVATSAGATLQCTLTGKTIYVVAARVFGSTAVYSILVDGVGVYDPVSRGNTFDETMTIAPVTGFPISSNVTPDLIRIPGQTDATHSITFTCITPGASGCMVFFMAAVSPDNSTANGPFVYSVSNFYNAAAQQTGQFTPQFTDLYQAQWRRVVDELASDGLQVVALDVTNPQVYNPLNATMVQGDGIHPTAAGTATIAAALASKATSAATPADRAEGRIPNFFAAYDCAGAGVSISPTGVGNTNLLYPAIPSGCLWSSTGGQTGRIYAGYDGTSFLERIVDDPTNANNAGFGHVWRLGDAAGTTTNTNLAIPGQITSVISSVDNGGTQVNINGSTTSQDVAEGSNGRGIANWPNNAVLTTNHNRVINADGGTVYLQSAHTTIAYIDSLGLHNNALVPIASAAPTGSCASFVNGTIVLASDGTQSECLGVWTIIGPALNSTTSTITGTALTASCDSGTVTIAGAIVGKPVSVSSTTGVDVGGAFSLRASVTAPNTVTVYVCGTGTPPSLAYNVSVGR